MIGFEQSVETIGKKSIFFDQDLGGEGDTKNP